MEKSYTTLNVLDINSVIIYLSFFLVSFLFCFFSEYCFKKNKKIFGWTCAFICVFVLCLLAALRDITVGGDIKVYLLPNFEIANKFSTFVDFFNVSSSQMEFLFSLIVYFCAKYTSLQCLFFLIEFLSIFPLYFVLYKNKENGALTFGFIVYTFLFYNFSLSGMRQSIAMSFVLLATYYLIKNRYKYFFLWGIVSCLFHSGAIIPIIFATIIFLVKDRRYFKKFLFIFGGILFLFFVIYNQVANVVASVFWIINPRYSYYIREYMTSKLIWSNIPNTEIIFKFGIVLLCYVFWKNKKTKKNQDVYILILSLLGRYFVLLNSRMYEALRIAYYFDIFMILLVSNTVEYLKLLYNKNGLKLILFIISFLYWIYFIMYIGGYGTNIYLFA